MKRTSLPRKEIDPSVPREMFWFSETSNKGFCPKCNSKLENEYQSYSLLTKQKREIARKFKAMGKAAGKSIDKKIIQAMEESNESNQIQRSK